MKNEVFEAQFQPLFTKFLTSHSETTTHMIRMWNLSNPETIKQKTYSDTDMQYISSATVQIWYKLRCNYNKAKCKRTQQFRQHASACKIQQGQCKRTQHVKSICFQPNTHNEYVHFSPFVCLCLSFCLIVSLSVCLLFLLLTLLPLFFFFLAWEITSIYTRSH